MLVAKVHSKEVKFLDENHWTLELNDVLLKCFMLEFEKKTVTIWEFFKYQLKFEKLDKSHDSHQRIKYVVLICNLRLLYTLLWW